MLLSKFCLSLASFEFLFLYWGSSPSGDFHLKLKLTIDPNLSFHVQNMKRSNSGVDEVTQMRSGSADSGKSDSQSASSTINDSLEGLKQEQVEPSQDESAAGVSAGSASSLKVESTAGADNYQEQSKLLKASLDNGDLPSTDLCIKKQPLVEQEQNNNQIETKTKAQQITSGNKGTNNCSNPSNVYDYLGLNMTAREMRLLISRRKKVDPKKAQINIRQKYEIIQKM